MKYAIIIAAALATTAAQAFTSDPNKMEVIGKFNYNGLVYAVTNLRCQQPNMEGMTFSAARIDLTRGISERGCGRTGSVGGVEGIHFRFTSDKKPYFVPMSDE